MKEIESLQTPESEGYVYVRESTALEKLIRRIRGAERVAVDTEADSLYNYFEKVCLVQLPSEASTSSSTRFPNWT